MSSKLGGTLATSLPFTFLIDLAYLVFGLSKVEVRWDYLIQKALISHNSTIDSIAVRGTPSSVYPLGIIDQFYVVFI